MKSLLSLLLAFIVFLPTSSFGKSRSSGSIPLYISAAGSFSLIQDSSLGSPDPFFDNIAKSQDTQHEFETGYGVTIAAGLLLKKRLRIEIEYGYKGFDGENETFVVNSVPQATPLNTEYSINSFLINTVFDWRNSSRFTPYIGVGLGFGFVETFDPATTFLGINVPEIESGDSAVAYQFMAGVNYWITRSLIGFLGYKYFATDDLVVGFITLEGIESHNLEAGLRFFFSGP